MNGIQEVILPSPKAMARSKYDRREKARQRDSISLDSPSHAQSIRSKSVTPVKDFDDGTFNEDLCVGIISPRNIDIIKPVPVSVLEDGSVVEKKSKN